MALGNISHPRKNISENNSKVILFLFHHLTFRKFIPPIFCLGFLPVGMVGLEMVFVRALGFETVFASLL